MSREIPDNLKYFIKNAISDSDDGYEYASELNRILNSDDCQQALSGKEIDALREYADEVRKVGEINHYTEEKIKEIEDSHFGTRGISGYLKVDHGSPQKSLWPF
ncbi:MAG: hypothetical protein HGA22_07685 [Clostridiales bacterium]|nr:hypothetical protein [Clostridiales bacterium]